MVGAYAVTIANLPRGYIVVNSPTGDKRPELASLPPHCHLIATFTVVTVITVASLRSATTYNLPRLRLRVHLVTQCRASTMDYALLCAFRQAAGGIPTIRLNARENAASES